MSDEEIGFMSAAELMVHYERGRLSPVEVVAAVLRHIEATEPKINAMVEVTARHAMDSARRAEAAYRAGVNRRLEGVPVTIKDLQETANIPTRYGSWSRKDNVPTVDAPCVTRLHEAGAVMLGKTTVPEFGWKGVSQSPLTGVTSNPWKAGYNAGASSAGAGAAAAAGYGPLHQGGDGAGSIRMPAHFCGVFGMKPTHGRIPNWPISNNDLATHMGPLTRTVKDAALMLEAMSGPHPWDIPPLRPRRCPIRPCCPPRSKDAGLPTVPILAMPVSILMWLRPLRRRSVCLRAWAPRWRKLLRPGGRKGRNWRVFSGLPPIAQNARSCRSGNR